MESMIRTLTPSPIMLWAIEANLFLLALGVLDVGGDPGVLERLGEQRRVVQRVARRRRGVGQDRRRPCRDAFAGLPDGGALAPLVGGLSRLQAAVTLAAPAPLLLPPLLELLLLSEPQAARPPEPMSSAAPRATAR